MIRTSCHCGAVGFEIETAPTEVTECNCSICRRYGVLWAYYPRISLGTMQVIGLVGHGRMTV